MVVVAPIEVCFSALSQRAGLWVARRLLHRLRIAAPPRAKCGGDGHGPSSLGVCEQVPPAAPVTSVVSTEEGTATKHHHCCSHSTGNTHALLLPLPHALHAT